MKKTKIRGKNLLVPILCLSAVTCASAGVAVVNGGFDMHDPIIAAAEKIDSRLADVNIDFEKAIDEKDGAPFGGDDIIYIWWKDGYSGSTWGALNVACGEGKVYGDMIEISTATATKTAKEWGIKRILTYGHAMGFCFESDAIKKADVISITLKAGLCPIQNANGWGNDATDSSATANTAKALDADIKMYVNHASQKYETYVDALNIATAPQNTSYEQGGTFDPAGMTLSVTYYDGSSETVDVTADMCSYDFSETGEKTVTVTYRNATVAQSVTVTAAAKTLGSISVSYAQGSSASAVRFEKAVTGLTVNAAYSDGSTEPVALSACTLDGFDPWQEGEQTVTVEYRGKSAEAKITVGEPDTTKGLEIEYENTGKVSDGGLNIYVSFKGLTDVPAKMIADIEDLPGSHIAEYIELDGKTVTQLMSEGKIARVCTVGDKFVIHMDDPSYNADKVKQVKLKAGLQWVGAEKDHWGAWGSIGDDYFNHDEAILKHDVIIYSLGADGWGEAVSKLEVISHPAEDTLQNTDVDLTGLKLAVTYANSGKTVEIDGANKELSVTGFDKTKLGSQTVTVSYRGENAETTVNVVAAPKSIAVEGKVTAEQYGRINIDGVNVVVTFEDESTSKVALTLDMLGELDLSETGEKTVTVGYAGKTVEITVEVGENETSKITGFTTESVKNGGENSAKDGWGYAVTIAGVPTTQKAMLNVDGYRAGNGQTNGDLVLIGDKTFAEVKASEGKGRLVLYGNTIVIQDLNDYIANHPDITIKAGFTWYNTADGNGFYVGNGTNDFNAVYPGVAAPQYDYVVLADMYATLVGDRFGHTATAITADYTGDDVLLNGKLDTDGIVVTATLKKGGTEVVVYGYSVTDFDSSSSGEKTATVTYQGKTAVITVNVSAKQAVSIAITKSPKTEYWFGMQLDLTGMEVSATVKDLSDESTSTVAIDAAQLDVSGFDPYKIGEQTVTVAYGSLTTTYTVTMTEAPDSYGLTVDYSDYLSYETTQLRALIVGTNVAGEVANNKFTAIWLTGNEANTLDKIKINGVLGTELKEKGLLTRICFWGNQIVLHFDSDKLVPTTWHDNYVEGESELVETVELLRGFQWYTSADGNDYWGGSAEYVPVSGAVVKENVLLVNNDGNGYTRMLKMNGDDIADDALAIVTLPTKIEYTVGEELDLSGMVVKAKYQDGGEENIVISYGDVDGFRSNVAGEQTLTVSYAGAEVTFKVTVKAAQPKPDDGDKSPDGESDGAPVGAIVGGVVGGVAALGIAAGVTVAVMKRKERNSSADADDGKKDETEE